MTDSAWNLTNNLSKASFRTSDTSLPSSCHPIAGTDSEYYLSEAMNELIARELVHCQVLPTQELWLGVTFPGDHARVAESLRALVDSKVYPRSLWGSPLALPSD